MPPRRGAPDDTEAALIEPEALPVNLGERLDRDRVGEGFSRASMGLRWPATEGLPNMKRELEQLAGSSEARSSGANGKGSSRDRTARPPACVASLCARAAARREAGAMMSRRPISALTVRRIAGARDASARAPAYRRHNRGTRCIRTQPGIATDMRVAAFCVIALVIWAALPKKVRVGNHSDQDYTLKMRRHTLAVNKELGRLSRP
jgi:hypothetical protein